MYFTGFKRLGHKAAYLNKLIVSKIKTKETRIQFNYNKSKLFIGFKLSKKNSNK